jgi:hypothetical protein
MIMSIHLSINCSVLYVNLWWILYLNHCNVVSVGVVVYFKHWVQYKDSVILSLLCTGFVAIERNF